MPREYVRGELDFGDGVESVLDLSWSREAEYVQIGTIARDKVDHTTVAEGQYLQLNRDGCNQLIRFIRRARDQAFGRDE